MLCRLEDNRTEVDGYGHKLRNNLSYKSRRDISRIDLSKSDAANNSFTLGLKLSDKDFMNVDESELVRPRQANGDLPTTAASMSGCRIEVPGRPSAPSSDELP